MVRVKKKIEIPQYFDSSSTHLTIQPKHFLFAIERSRIETEQCVHMQKVCVSMESKGRSSRIPVFAKLCITHTYTHLWIDDIHIHIARVVVGLAQN